MKRGHVFTQPGYGKAEQEKILYAAGVKRIWYDDLPAVARSQRKGDVLYAATLRGIGSSADGIDAALDLIHSKGAAVIDAETGWRSDGPMGAKLMRQATLSISRTRLGGDARLKASGRKGGKEAGKTRRKGWRPWPEIEAIWFNKSLSTEAVMELINDGFRSISYIAVYRKFGKRGVISGRRSRKK